MFSKLLRIMAEVTRTNLLEFTNSKTEEEKNEE